MITSSYPPSAAPHPAAAVTRPLGPYRPQRARRSGFALVLAAIAASFGLGSALHAGLIVAVAGTRQAEPVIVPAAIVEGICTLAFLLAALALATGHAHTHRLVPAAHLIGITGVLLGMTMLDLRRGPRTESNDLYHVAVLTLMLLTHTWYRHPTRPAGRT